MKKNIFIIPVITALVFLPSLFYAQESSVTVGILDFVSKDKNPQEIQAISSDLAGALGKYKFITLAERSKLSSIIKEIEMGQSGLVDENSAIQAGKLSGARILIDGSVRESGISARAIYTETGKVIAVSSVKGTADIETMGKDLARGIEVYLAKENIKMLRNDTPEINFDFWITNNSAGKTSKIVPGSRDAKIKIGSPISFHFKPGQDGFVTIVDIQPGGDVVLLYPNDYSSSNAVNAGTEYSIPSDDDSFELHATEPAGTDTIAVFFTKRKVDWLDKSKLSGEGFKTVNDGEKFAASRGFSVQSTKLKKNEWKSAVLSVEVVK